VKRKRGCRGGKVAKRKRGRLDGGLVAALVPA
jgi:hypothetical protein